MPNAKISQLTAASTPLTGTELVPVVQGGVTKNVSAEDIVKSTVPSGTANGVLYLNASKQVSSGSALTFDGANFKINTSGTLQVGNTAITDRFNVSPNISGSGATIYSTNFAGNAYSLLFFDASQFVFRPNSNEAMRLTSTGLGIGTSSPTTRLQLTKANTTTGLGNGGLLTLENTDGGAFDQRAEILFKNVGQVTSAISSSYTGFAAGPQYAGALIFATKGGADSAIVERARIDSSGNLGLGVTPSDWSATNIKALQVFNGGFANNGASGYITNNAFYAGGGAYTPTYIGTGPAQMISFNRTGAYDIQFLTAPSGTAGNTISFTQAMTLDASGNLLIGKTTPLYSIQGIALAWGNKEFGVTSDSGTPIYVNKKTSTGNLIGFFYNDALIGTISTNGTATAYNTSSDYRLKNVTGPITNSGTYIDSLNPVEGTWKADGSTFVGLIAHEVQEVSRTQVATGVKDGEEMQAMDYSSAELIANLIAEVKSLRARVAALEAA